MQLEIVSRQLRLQRQTRVFELGKAGLGRLGAPPHGAPDAAPNIRLVRDVEGQVDCTALATREIARIEIEQGARRACPSIGGIDDDAGEQAGARNTDGVARLAELRLRRQHVLV